MVSSMVYPNLVYGFSRAVIHHGSKRQAGEYVVGRRQCPPPLCKETRFPETVRLKGGMIRTEPLQHVQIFLLDDRPAVMTIEERAAVGPKGRVQRPPVRNRLQRLDKL